MRKKKIYKMMSLILSLTMIAGSLVYPVEKGKGIRISQRQKTLSENEFLLNAVTMVASAGSSDSNKSESIDSSKNVIEKDETVYELTDSNGGHQKTIVSSWLKSKGISGPLEDVANLSEIKNVKGEEDYTLNQDGTITWEGKGEDIYYRGESKESLPVELKITYYLDDQEVKPEEILGKSGKLRVKFEYRNQDKKTVEVDGNKYEVYTPFLCVTGTLIDNEKFSNVEVTNGEIVSDGEHSALVGFGLPGLKESLKLDEMEMDGKNISLDIPESFEFTADVRDFSMSMCLTVVSSNVFDQVDLNDSTLEDWMNDLKEDSDALGEGADSLEEGSKDLSKGASELNSNMESFTQGTEDLKNGIDAYTQGVEEAKEGAGQLEDGSKKVSTGSKTIKNAMKEATFGSKKLKNGAVSLKDGMMTLDSGIVSLHTGLNSLEAGTITLTSGLKTLSQGTTSLVTGLTNLDQGADSLNTGLSQVQTGADTFNTGLQTLTASSKGLNDACEKIAQGISGANSYGKALEENKDTLVGLYKQYAALANQSEEARVMAEKIGSLVVALYGADALGLEADPSNPGLTKVIAQLADETTGIPAFENGLSSYTGGLDLLASNFTSLKQGIDSAATGAGTLKAGADSALTGAKSLDSGAKEAYKGAKELKKGASSAASGAGQLENGSETLVKGTKSLVNGSESLYQGNKSIYKGSKSLSLGSKKVNKGINALWSGLVTLDNNSTALRDGASALKTGSDQIADGIGQIDSGLITLKDGMVKFNEEGIEKLTQGINDNLTGEYDRLKAVISAGQDYNSFSGSGQGEESKVKFLYKTEEVK